MIRMNRGSQIRSSSIFAKIYDTYQNDLISTSFASMELTPSTCDITGSGIVQLLGNLIDGCLIVAADVVINAGVLRWIGTSSETWSHLFQQTSTVSSTKVFFKLNST
eukprot:TRINITY_DN3971_c0_g2_i1.p1 TRINITY_DN3971_c0_g2~~TRINITY_DN3971_c0_g2_i1.p1  ORF type:complete len:107 (+),score=27.04 TRINITY_DN3971_c0_g2_i1:281-601(+)